MRRPIFLALAAVLATPAALPACSCIRMMSEREAFLRADVVFRGEVVAVDDVEAPGRSRMASYVFRVTRWKKSRGADTVAVRTGIGSGDCGYDFRGGRIYTVYARRDGEGLATSICDMPWAIPQEPKRSPA